MPNILCFGTSLTSGYLDGGFNHWPYALAFKERICQLVPDLKWNVSVSGHDGGTCVQTPEEIYLPLEFRVALEQDCHDDVLVMVGSNDLARLHPAELVWQAWRPSLEYAHRTHDVNLFLIGLPTDKDNSAERVCLNGFVREWAEMNDHVYVSFPNNIERDSDGYHFSQDGSTTLGRYMALQVFHDYSTHDKVK